MTRFEKGIAACPEVQQCYYVTGEHDFVLVVLAASIADYEAFIRRVLHADDNVRSITTSVALSRVKVGLSVPIPRPRK